MLSNDTLINWHYPSPSEWDAIQAASLGSVPSRNVPEWRQPGCWHRSAELVQPVWHEVTDPLEDLGWDLLNADPELAAAAELNAQREFKLLCKEASKQGFVHLTQLQAAKVRWGRVHDWHLLSEQSLYT